MTDNGTITITAAGGAAPLSYSIDGGMTFSSNSVFNNVREGDYNIVVEGAGGCTGMTTTVVDGPMPYSITTSSTQDTDCEIDNGTITITVDSGGTPPFMYSIDGGVTFETTGDFMFLAEGIYSIVVSDSGGCTETGSATVLPPTELTALVSETDDTDCDGDNGSIFIQAVGGTAPYTYSIDGGLTFVSDIAFIGLVEGSYDVVVNDSQNCSTAVLGVQIEGPDCVLNGTIGDLVFIDSDGDGTQDPGEIGLPDVRVELFNSNDVLVSINITDSNGVFLFEDVPPGEYYVRFTRLGDFIPTFPNASGNTNTDSNVDDTNGPNTTPNFIIGQGEVDLSIDFGVFECIPIGENIFLDVDEDGIRDNSENGINGVPVELFRMVGGLWVKTDIQFSGHKPGTGSDDGFYKFCAPPGTYYLNFDVSEDRLVNTIANRGFDENTDSDVTNRFGRGTTDEFTVLSGDERCDIGAGFVPAGSIGDFIWQDDNFNGLRDEGEPGFAGVMVQALNVEGELLAVTTSDDDGNYTLDMLPQDNYFVRASLPEGHTVTTPNVGADESRDSDIDGSNGENTTRLFNVQPGDHIGGVDIGVVSSALPVTWLGITGEAYNTHNKIKWSVAQERNVSHYELMSSHGTPDDFRTIAIVESEYKNFPGRLDYSAEDDSYSSGINYYMVKQYDLDDRFSFSEVVSIVNEESEVKNYTVNVFPNPVREELNVGLELFQNREKVTIRMYDNLGQLVQNSLVLDFNLDAGYKVYPIDVVEFQGGIYTLEIIVDNRIELRKVAITK